MGTWRLEEIQARYNRMDSNLCGHDLFVTLRMRYTPAFFGKFKETPALDWNEKITVIDHHKLKPEYWTVEHNQYVRNPISRTMESWARRYLDAYESVMRVGPPAGGPGTNLLDRRGRPVSPDCLVPGLKRVDSARKTDSVRTYLRRHGGILEITIHDKPEIRLTTSPIRRERVIEFTVGVVGTSAPQWRGFQYVLYDSRPATSERTVRFTDGSTPVRLATESLEKGSPNGLADMWHGPEEFQRLPEGPGYVL